MKYRRQYLPHFADVGRHLTIGIKKEKKMRKREIKLRKQLKDTLGRKYREGHGTPKTGKVHNGTDVIHSHRTYKTYMTCADRFADWCKEHGIRVMEEARAAVPEYIKERLNDGKSAFTVAKDTAAIAKAMDCRMTDLNVKLPSRHRADIKNNRGEAKRAEHFSERNHKELVEFCKNTGLRRDELAHLKGSDLKIKDGKAYIVLDRHSGSKGGKAREVEVLRNNEHVADLMRSAGNGLVFSDGIPCGANIHHYRGDYAKALYREVARPISQLSGHDLYCCRGAYKGLRYDRQALLYVSKNLGHNREDVVVNNYFYS
jgi:hypothetical protein